MKRLIFLVILTSALYGCENESNAKFVRSAIIDFGYFKINADRAGVSIQYPYNQDSYTSIDSDLFVIQSGACGGIEYKIVFRASGYPVYSDVNSVKIISNSLMSVDPSKYYSFPGVEGFKYYQGPIYRINIQAGDPECATRVFEKAQSNR